MVPEERRYWVRNEQGLVWGPYPRAALERMRGRLNLRCTVSLDGREYAPSEDYPELAELLAAAEPVRVPVRGAPSQPPLSASMRAAAEAVLRPAAAQAAEPSHPPAARPTRPAPVRAEVEELAEPQAASPTADSAEPAAESAPAAEAAPPEIATPTQVEPVRVPEEGDLAAISAVRLYGLAAATGATGWLQLHTAEGGILQISFRRGTPDQASSDDPELGVFRFLVDRKVITPDQAVSAEEHRARAGQDALSALFQLQLIPPADAHRLLGEHALHVLDRVLSTWRGTFSFEADAPAPPGAFPLGSKWTLLAESTRRLDAAVVRARLGRRLQRRVQRSGGNGVGRIDELALNAQESRLYAAIDGTRTGEELLKSLPEPGTALRLLHLLVELGHLSFDEQDVHPPRSGKKAEPRPPAAARAPSKPPASTVAEAPAQRPLPEIARQPPSTPPAAAKGTPKSVPPAAPEPPPSRPPPPSGTPSQQVAELRRRLESLEKADHYAALGIDRAKFNAVDARKAFFQLAREYHPDTVMEGSPPEMRTLKERLFSRINEASEVLADEARRKEYEAELTGEARKVDVGNIFAAEDAFQKAELLIKSKRYAEGIESLEEAIKLYPDEGEFYAWRGWARFMLAKERRIAQAEAVAECKKALKLNPHCLAAWLFQGQMSKIVGELKAAEASFKKALEIDDKNLEAIRELRYLWPGKKS